LAALSARQWCEQVAASTTLVNLLQAFIRLNTYCNDLECLSAEAAVTQLRRSLRGVTYVNGGWRSIVEGLATRARAVGVEIATQQSVTEIEHSSTSMRVTTADASFEARAVVLACGGPKAVNRLVPGLAFDDPGPPISAACLDLGLSSPPEVGFILGIDEPLYLSLHDPPARLAPEGGSTLSVMEYGDEGRNATERLDKVARLAGVSGDDVKERRLLSSLVVAHSVPRIGTSFEGRPGVQGNVEGCFLAGDWVGARGLLADAAVSSGVAAGRLAAQR
jgi:phytoene dehydrogenase-like protein